MPRHVYAEVLEERTLLSTVSIGDVEISEGDSGTTAFTFDVTLDQAVGNDVTFDFTTVADSAQAGIDFTGKSGSGTITAGQATTSITVDVSGDTTMEADERFFVDVSNLDAGGLDVQLAAVDLNISEVGFFDTPNFAYDVQVSGSTAYVADRASGLRVLDVSNPASISELGFLDLPGDAQGVEVIGNTVYVAEGFNGLRVLDVSDSASISDLGSFNTPGLAWDVEVIGTTAYVADNTGGLRVLDVSDPGSISEIGSFNTHGDAYDVQVIGSTAYVADFTSGLRVLDVSDPANISELGFFDTPQRALQVDVVGSTAYVADGFGGLRVLDVSDPGSISELGFFITPDQATGVSVVGSKAYVTDNTSGLRVLDVSNPTSISELGFLGNTGWAVQVTGSTAYVAASIHGLRVLDVNFTSRATGTILNDDVANVSVADLTLTEGDSDTTAFTFDLTLDQVLGNDVTFDFATVADSAQAGSDFTSTSGSGTILAGQTKTSITVDVSGDTTLELDEQFFVDVSNLDGGGLDVHLASADLIVSERDFFHAAGFAYAVQVVGSTAYVADGLNGVQVLDVSNPASVSLLGSFNTPGEARDVRVVGTTAYVADFQGGLRVLDVSDPASINELGFFDTPSFAQGVQVVGNTAYVADGVSGLRVLDVTNPATISELGSFAPFGMIGVEVMGNTAYVAAGPAGLRVLDVSDPASINEVGFFDTPGIAIDVQVVQGRAYVADDNRGLRVLDVSNLAAGISELGFFETANFVRDVDVIGSTAYLADGTHGLRVLDVSNPARVSEVGLFGTPGLASGVQVVGNTVYFAHGGSGLRVLDVTSRVTGTIQNDDDAILSISDVSQDESDSGTTGYTFDVTLERAVDQDVTFDFTTVEDTAQAGSDFTAASGSRTIPAGQTTTSITVNVSGDTTAEATEQFFVDLSNPDAGGLGVHFDSAVPSGGSEIGFFETAGDARDVQVVGTTAYFADGDNGLRVLDVSDPGNISELGFFETTDIAYDVQVMGTTAYVAAGDRGLLVLDVSDPANIGELGVFDTHDRAIAVDVVGSTANVADADGGLRVLDVSDPANITELGFFETSHLAVDVQVVDSTAYVADRDGGLWVLDVSSPASIGQLGFFQTTGSAFDVEVVGPTAYIADGESGLWVLDVSNPAGISVLGIFDTGDSAFDVQVVDTTAYVADGDRGLLVLDVSDPGNISTLAEFDGFLGAVEVQVVGSTAYVADFDFFDEGSSGLRVLDVSSEVARGIGTIRNDDVATVQTADVTMSEGDSGDTPFTFGVTLDQAIDQDVTFNFLTLPNSAQAGVDFTAITGSGTIAAGKTTTSITVDVRGDTTAETDEQFFVDLWNFEAAGLDLQFHTASRTIGELGFIDTPGHAVGVQVLDGTAYVADRSNGGLRVLNVSNPGNISERGAIVTRGGAYDVQVVGTTAYVADGFSGLLVLDVSDPANITDFGFFDTPGFAYDVQVVDDTAYVADSSGVRVLDVSDPASISQLGEFNTPGGQAKVVEVVGNTAYVADELSGLRVLNVSDPENISEIGFFQTSIFDVEVVDHTAYVAEGTSLRVLDVTNLANITELGTFTTPDFTFNVQVIGDTAYVADGLSGLQVLNVSNPANISMLGAYNTPGDANDVQVIGDTAYVADGDRGLRVLNVNVTSQAIGTIRNDDGAPASAGANSQASVLSQQNSGLSANDVTVSLLDGVSIVGDDNANALTIELVDGNVVVTGRDGTTVNGSDQPVTVSGRSIESGLNVSLGNGNDSLRVLGIEVTGATEIATGLGDDEVIIDRVTFGQSVVIGTGAGVDDVYVFNSTASADLSIYTTTGDDNIQIDDTKIGGNLKAFVGDGDDVVNLVGGIVSGDVNVSGWYGNDGSLIENELIEGNLTLRARGGRAGNEFGILPADDNDLWDVDGNGASEQEDGLLNIRYLAGFRGAVLVNGALGQGATRTDPDEIVSYLDRVYALLASESFHEPLNSGIAALRNLASLNNDGDDSASNIIKTQDAEVGGDLTVHTANGVDTVELLRTAVSGHTMAETGSGDDAFRVESLAANGFTAMTGGGSDLVAATGESVFAGDVNVSTGDDDDAFVIDDTTYFEMAATFDGGPGANDTFEDSFAPVERHRTTPRQVAAFENVLLDTDGVNPALDVFAERLATLETAAGPQVVDDTFQHAERSTFFSPVSILDNDRGSELALVEEFVTSTQGVRVFLERDGTFEWTARNMETLPLPGESVTDTFMYTVEDAIGRQQQGQVSIHWTAPPSLDYLLETDEATAITLPAGGGLLSQNNGRQEVGQAITLPITDYDAISEMGAAVTVHADGGFVYDPTGSQQLQDLRIDDLGVYDSFGYTLDGQHKGTVYVLVKGLSNAPDDEYAALVDLESPLVVDAQNGVLTNDPGSNLEIIDFQEITELGATVTMGTDGSFTYTVSFLTSEADQLVGLAAGEEGPIDRFVYIAGDGTNQHTAVVLVRLTGINEPPRAADDAAQLQNGELSGNLNLLDNDLDPDTDDTFTITGFDNTSSLGATVNVNADGTWSYDPAGVGALSHLTRLDEVADSFTYTITDAAGLTATATVHVTNVGIDHPPVPNPRTYTVGENGLLVVPDVDGLLADATDRDDDAIFVINAEENSAAQGRVTVNRDGSFVYDPHLAAGIRASTPGETLTDSFSYTISDGANEVIATVNIAVFGETDGSQDEYTALPDLTGTFESLNVSADGGVLLNDPLINPQATPGARTSLLGASVTLNADGSFTWDPSTISPANLAAAFANSPVTDVAFDSFQYTASGDGGATLTETVTVRLDDSGPVPGSAPPVVNPVTAQIVGRELVITATNSFDASQLLRVTPIGQDDLFIFSELRDGPHTGIDVGSVLLQTRRVAGWNRLGPFATGDFDLIRFEGSDANEVFQGELLTIPVHLSGNGGNDVLVSGSADDMLFGGPGDDVLRSFAGNDVLDGDIGADQMFAGDGEDELRSADDGSTNLLLGGADTDLLAFNAPDIRLDNRPVDSVAALGSGQAVSIAVSNTLGAVLSTTQARLQTTSSSTIFDQNFKYNFFIAPRSPSTRWNVNYWQQPHYNLWNQRQVRELNVTGQTVPADGHFFFTMVGATTADTIEFSVRNLQAPQGQRLTYVYWGKEQLHHPVVHSRRLGSIKDLNESLQIITHSVDALNERIVRIPASALLLKPGDPFDKILFTAFKEPGYQRTFVRKKRDTPVAFEFERVGITSGSVATSAGDIPVGLVEGINRADLSEDILSLPDNAKRELYTNLVPVPGHRDPDTFDLIINGPTLYGFRLRGKWKVSSDSAEVFTTDSATLISPAGNLNLPVSIKITTSPDRFRAAGRIQKDLENLTSGIEIGGLPLFHGSQSNGLKKMQELTGLNLSGLSGQNGWGIDLGANLTTGLFDDEAPLADAIPYLYLKAGFGGDLIKFGENSLSLKTFVPEFRVAFDPADPSVYISVKGNGLFDFGVIELDGFEFGGSIKGRLKWQPKQTPNLFQGKDRNSDDDDTGDIYGHIFLKGKVVIPAHRILYALGIPADAGVELGVGLEGSLVLDLDADNDGKFLGSGTRNYARLTKAFRGELVSIFKGQKAAGSRKTSDLKDLPSIDQLLVDGLLDMRLGVNGTVTAELGLGPKGVFGVEVPLANASVIWKDHKLAFAGGTANPLDDTPLDFVKIPGASADLGIELKVKESGRYDRRKKQFVLDRVKLDVGIESGFELKITDDISIPLSPGQNSSFLVLTYEHDRKHVFVNFRSRTTIFKILEFDMHTSGDLFIEPPKIAPGDGKAPIYLLQTYGGVSLNVHLFKIFGTVHFRVANIRDNDLALYRAIKDLNDGKPVCCIPTRPFINLHRVRGQYGSDPEKFLRQYQHNSYTGSYIYLSVEGGIKDGIFDGSSVFGGVHLHPDPNNLGHGVIRATVRIKTKRKIGPLSTPNFGTIKHRLFGKFDLGKKRLQVDVPVYGEIEIDF